MHTLAPPLRSFGELRVSGLVQNTILDGCQAIDTRQASWGNVLTKADLPPPFFFCAPGVHGKTHVHLPLRPVGDVDDPANPSRKK